MVEIHTPSLAERMEDLPLLARHFVKKFSQQYNKESAASRSARR